MDTLTLTSGRHYATATLDVDQRLSALLPEDLRAVVSQLELAVERAARAPRMATREPRPRGFVTDKHLVEDTFAVPASDRTVTNRDNGGPEPHGPLEFPHLRRLRDRPRYVSVTGVTDTSGGRLYHVRGYPKPMKASDFA